MFILFCSSSTSQYVSCLEFISSLSCGLKSFVVTCPTVIDSGVCVCDGLCVCVGFWVCADADSCVCAVTGPCICSDTCSVDSVSSTPSFSPDSCACADTGLCTFASSFCSGIFFVYLCSFFTKNKLLPKYLVKSRFPPGIYISVKTFMPSLFLFIADNFFPLKYPLRINSKWPGKFKIYTFL